VVSNVGIQAELVREKTMSRFKDILITVIDWSILLGFIGLVLLHFARHGEIDQSLENNRIMRATNHEKLIKNSELIEQNNKLLRENNKILLELFKIHTVKGWGH
jgi:hypothetical protein